jgi:uncharacterized damage-inducible protein DinB
MGQVAAMLQELEQEAHTTRRLLERVPGDRLEWKPHPKARTLGQLALHVAAVPGAVASFACAPSPVQVPTFAGDPSPASAAELLTALRDSIETAKAKVGALDDAALAAPWRLMAGDRELIAAPRGVFLRSVMLNHWYHHRGQLSAYLRELDVPIPSIYGPSADENPFG